MSDIGPSETELYEVYLREGYDDIAPFKGLTCGTPEGWELALEKWNKDNGQFGVGS